MLADCHACSRFLDLSRHLVVLQYFVVCSWSKIQYFLVSLDAEVERGGLTRSEGHHLLVEVLKFLFEINGLEA
jgi:hypothetical protein